MADWDLEIFDALAKKENNKLLVINLRNTYAFLAAMCQLSPIGSLIEFIIRISKK